MIIYSIILVGCLFPSSQILMAITVYEYRKDLLLKVKRASF